MGLVGRLPFPAAGLQFWNAMIPGVNCFSSWNIGSPRPDHADCRRLDYHELFAARSDGLTPSELTEGRDWQPSCHFATSRPHAFA
jgi:hypothetical protein